jgi:deazaflavin-dependent oxidoreductase (nitroreductase family)
MPSDLTLKAMNAVHRLLLRVSGGRRGWEAARMPVLELTTTGRKSGKLHSVMLTSPVQEGPAIVIVASRGGDDHHPAWFLNLRKNPEVEVAMSGRSTQHMRARIAGTAERARLWPRVVAAHANYQTYQTRTDREIPIVLLEPIP